MHRSRPLLALLALVSLAACAETPTPLTPETPLFAKPGSGSTDTDPRAKWEFFPTLSDGTTATMIYGDGRAVDGSPTTDGSSAYQGGVCGVHAKIFVANGGGDAVIDPDKNYPSQSCYGVARVLRYDLGGTVVDVGSFTNARGVFHLTSGGASKTQDMNHSYTGIANCERLQFVVAQGSGVRVTRLSAEGAAGQWRVETIGDHTGRCFNYVKGKYVHREGVDPKFVLPYHAVITEVR